MQQLIDIVESTRKARLDEDPREHLGCSEVGHECERAVWLGFRHATKKEFSGRTHDKLRRGKHEEKWIREDFAAADMPVMNDQGKVWFSHHFGGSIDGEFILLGEATLLEAKCLESKRVRALQKKGLKAAEPMAYIQVQLYMLGRNLKQCLYWAVNKDTSEPYPELVELDKEFAERHRNRALRIVASEDVPFPLYNASPTWYICKMCDHYGICHDDTIPERNCRTCRWSTPAKDGWICEGSGTFGECVGCYEVHPNIGGI